MRRELPVVALAAACTSRPSVEAKGQLGAPTGGICATATRNFGFNTLAIAPGQEPEGFSLGMRHTF